MTQGIDSSVRSLVDLARERAQRHPERGYRFLADGVQVSESLSYGELDRDARRIASLLRAEGLQNGARVILLFPAGLEFLRAFWACFYAGIIAVPVPPPQTGRPARTLARLRAIVKDCDADAVLTSTSFEATTRTLSEGIAPELGAKRVIVTDGGRGDPDSWRTPATCEVAVIQYTSGSTRDPRGVTVSHDNFLHNLSLLRTYHLEQEHMVMVSWLPLYHDMGLIRGMMSPLHMGGDCIMMPPMQFVQRPAKWLAAITAHRGTTTGAPNFGYELAARRVPDKQLEQIDLSSLAVAFCTAEPIRASTVKSFIDRFERCGFRRAAFRPAYGLAESTVAVAGELGDGPQTYRVSAAALRAGRVVAASEGSNELVSCGAPLGDMEVVIADETGGRAAHDRVGEVWIRGRSVARGYWNREEDTRAVFGARLADGTGPYLRTGDAGFFTPSGGLCIAGRLKDLVIVRGVNHYPQDIEAAIEAAVPNLRPGCSTAFAIDAGDGEGLAVVVEYDARAAGTMDAAQWSQLVTTAARALGDDQEIVLHALCVVAAGQVPKTASGKVQRSLARQMYLDGELEVLHSWVAPYAESALKKEGVTADDVLWFVVGWLLERLQRPVAKDASFADLALGPEVLSGLLAAISERFKIPALAPSIVDAQPTLAALAAHVARDATASAPPSSMLASATPSEQLTWTTDMGIEIVRVTPEEVVAELEIGPRHLQAYGVVHGGVHAGLIESAASLGAAVTARARGQGAPMGLENHTSFVRAVSGGRLRVTATPITRGRTSQLWEGTVRDQQGRVVATGRVRLVVPSRADDGAQAAGEKKRDA